MLTITVLPARYGDSILIEYEKSPGTAGRILIDGGTSGTRADIVKQVTHNAVRHIDLCIVTHIDRDHIEGILSLLEAPTQSFSIGEIWFNGYKHLIDDPNFEVLGAVQGERLTAAILANRIAWNQSFDGGPAAIADQLRLPVILLPGDMKITLLSPTQDQLVGLIGSWETEVIEAGLIPGYGYLAEPEEEEDDTEMLGPDMIDIEALARERFEEDDSPSNGSSIAFLLEYRGKKMLFTGDAHPSQIMKSLDTLHGQNDVVIDFWKISHHGGKGNTGPELVKRITCAQYIFSTSGIKFPHPSRETIAWILKNKRGHATLYFNYRSDNNKVWDDADLKSEYDYETVYPAHTPGIKIEV